MTIQQFSIIAFFTIISTHLIAQGNTLFNDNFIHEIRFENVDTSIFINSKNYQSVTMKINGVTVTNVGLKKKGNISASHTNNKVPFKIKTNEYVNGQEFDGIREFTLNNSFQDPSLMREKITFDIANDMGLYSLRTAFAKVYIDNLYWGVYTIVEGKDEMYKHIFFNREGDGIESTDYGDMCYYGANRSNYQHPAVGDRYIVDNGDETSSWNRLIPMLDKANNTANANYVDTVSNYLNIHHFAKYQALNVYFLNFDSYIGYIGNQVYFYDEIVTYWQVIPWDFNASFGLWNTNNFGPSTYPILPTAVTVGCIGSAINDVPELKNTYLQAMCEFTKNIADTVAFNLRIDNFKNQIKMAVYNDWRKEFTNADFDNATAYGYYAHNGETVPALKTFAKDRYEKITQELNGLNYSCTTPTSEIVEKSNFLLFPNPANQYINITLADFSPAPLLQVYNNQGQLIFEKVVAKSTANINTSNWQSGIYYFKIGEKSQKLLIVR